MNMKHFQKRFTQSIKAPSWFLKALRDIHPPLDCYYNRLEDRWQVIQWVGEPMNSEFHWVMTVQGPNQDRVDPSQHSIDRIRYLKKIFESDQAQQIAEIEQDNEESGNKREMTNILHELSKDLRKPLLASYDGVVSTFNRFI